MQGFREWLTEHGYGSCFTFCVFGLFDWRAVDLVGFSTIAIREERKQRPGCILAILDIQLELVYSRGTGNFQKRKKTRIDSYRIKHCSARGLANLQPLIRVAV